MLAKRTIPHGERISEQDNYPRPGPRILLMLDWLNLQWWQWYFASPRQRLGICWRAFRRRLIFNFYTDMRLTPPKWTYVGGVRWETYETRGKEWYEIDRSSLTYGGRGVLVWYRGGTRRVIVIENYRMDWRGRFVPALTAEMTLKRFRDAM